MHKYEDLHKIIAQGNVVQVVTHALRDAMGQVAQILPNYLVLSPHTDEEIIEEYGPSIQFSTAIPIEEINVLIVLTNNKPGDDINGDERT